MPPATPSPSRTSFSPDVGKPSSLRFFTRLTSSAALDATAKFLRRQLWAWPVIAALVIGVAGWWVNSSIESALREQRTATMTTILKADVEALRGWVKREEQMAVLLADAPEVRQAARAISAPELGRSSDPKAVEALREWFATRLADRGYHGFFLVNTSAVIVAAEDDQAQGKPLTGTRKTFFDKVLAGQPGVSKPYKAVSWLKDENGVLRMGVPTMLAAAPVKDDSGKVIAALSLRIRPDADFTRILQTAQAGKSGETYAFDSDGLMLSQSRFDEEMKEYGLLVDRPEERSILTLYLKNPGANLTEYERPRTRRAEWPLTKPVVEAPNGDGYDVDGYPDYRGVPKLGAWTWLPEYDIGVVTEVNRDEAFRPVYILRGALGVLLVLLLLAAAGLFAAMLFMSRQQQKLRAAVLEAKQLGQYTLEEKLGQGGMGTVYKARHAMLRRPTAVKLLDVANMTDIAITRFEREVQMTSGLTHPNTVAIYDYGRTPEGLFYYAMEYLEGTNLDDLVRKYGPLPEARVVYLMKQVCGALAEAHATGLVHRDVKPANIFLTRRGGVADFVKVLDFGLVKVADGREANVTSANTVTGTPLYLSPEGISRPDTVGPPADVYALGAVAYYLLVGQPVFDGKAVVEICMKHLNAEPTPPSAHGVLVGTAFEQLLLQCLAKAPEARPANARELLAALEDCPQVDKWTAALAASWWANPPAPITNAEPLATQVMSTPGIANIDMTRAITSNELRSGVHG